MSFARYVKTSGQSVQHGIGAGVGFDSARTTSPDVAANGTNQFTFTKAGTWLIETAVQVVGGPKVKGSPWQALCTIGPGPDSTAVVYTAQAGYGPATTSTLGLALTAVRPFAVDDTVAVNILMTCPNGGTFTLAPNSDQVHISFAYLGAS